MFFHSAYSEKPRVPLICGKSRTKQSFKEECDINRILQQFRKTGLVDFFNKHSPQYGDVTGINFQQAMDNVVAVRNVFDDLPAVTRARFRNDPAEFVDFLSDPANDAEAIKLGLKKAPKASTGAAAPAAAPGAQSAQTGEPTGDAVAGSTPAASPSP